jgi:hypothetical protein
MLASQLYTWVQAWTSQLPLTASSLSSQASSCTRTSFEAFEALRSGPVPHVPDASKPQLSSPRFLEGLNASAGEQWAFDATSNDGTSGLMLAFYHDPTYAFLGPGNLRLSLDLVFPNGSNWALADYLSHADVDICPSHGTTGVWYTPPSQHASGSVVSPHSYRYFVAEDNSVAAIELNTTRVQGTIRMRSMTSARPGPGASTWNAPGLHWASVIPAAQTSVDLMIDGAPLRWEGIGGHERWWAGQGWLDGLQGWQAVRAVVGPYILTYWAPTSRQAEGGILWPSAFLARNGKTVLEAKRSGPSSFQDDASDHNRDAPYVEHRALTASGKLVASDGGSGDHRQGFAKGYVLMFIDPRTRRRWEFSLTLKNMEFAFDVGDSSGGVAYVGTASGGEIGDDVYHGVFFNESVYVADLKVPKIYAWAAYWYYRVKASIFGH